MSRAEYSDECDGWEFICWRGAVASAIRGKRGQAFLRDMASALDAMPDKKLIADELRNNDGVCALGALGLVKGVPVDDIDPYDHERIASVFNISEALAREVVFMNDEGGYRPSPERRWEIVREWVRENLRINAEE